MKLALDTEKPPSPAKGSRTTCAADTSLFFRAMTKAADINRKQLVYELRVSKTLVDGWFSGARNDPFTQARRAVQMFKKRKDLLAAILLYIAGDDSFDEVVLERVQQIFAKVVS
jgi:hypothetical protein